LIRVRQFLGPGIIGVVIARRQNIGADQDAALHFGAKALAPAFLIQVGDVPHALRAMAELDPVNSVPG